MVNNYDVGISWSLFIGILLNGLINFRVIWFRIFIDYGWSLGND